MDAEKIQNGFIKYLRKDNVSGAALCLFKGEEANIFTYGLLDVNFTAQVTSDSLFEIGSITKPIIATLFSILHDKKEIDITTSIGENLKNFKIEKKLQEIKIKDLLNHTSGLPRLPPTFSPKTEDNPYKNISKKDFEEFLINPGLTTKQGKYCYSNFGYAILGEILKEYSQTEIQVIAAKLIFDPLEMKNTTFIMPLSNNIVSGYDKNNQKKSAWDFTFFEAAGAIKSSINDMDKFLKANLYSKNDTPIYNTHKLTLNNIALGWHYKNGFISKILGYNKYYWHNGQTGGFASIIAFNKHKNCGFVALLNKSIFPDSYFYHLISYLY